MFTARMKALVAFVALALLSVAPAAAGPDPGVAVIAHPGVKAKSLDADALQRYFLGKTTTWEGGGLVVLATLREGATHEAFLSAYVGKTPSQFTSHWRKLVFTGKASEPRSFASEVELVAYVAATPGAIGYVSAAAEKKDVAVIAVKD
jgi:ABC-type phosphate transport system substrate-binding protein